MFKFNIKSCSIFILLLLIETAIALFIKGGFNRHVFGDYLVVLLLFFLFKSFIYISNKKLALIVLCISFIIEFIQLTPLLEILGLQDNKLANIIVGNTFSVTDLLAYTLGYLTIIFLNTYTTCTLFSLDEIK